MTETVRETRSLPDAVVSFIREEKVLTTLLAFAFVFVKVLLVAKGDLATALAVIQTAGVTQVVVGAFLAGLPLLAACAATVGFYLSAVGRHGRVESADRRHDYLLRVLAVAVVALAFYYTPWLLTLAGAAACLGGFLLSSLAAWLSGLTRRVWVSLGHGLSLLRRFPLILALAFFLTWDNGLLLESVWVPHEALSMGGHKVEVGYVLDDSDGWITILETSTRSLLRLRDDQVKVRKLCLGKREVDQQASVFRKVPNLMHRPRARTTITVTCPKVQK